jgi:hypothetical protein
VFSPISFSKHFCGGRMAVFMIVGKSNPIYEAELGGIGKDDLAYLHQFILHSSLDQLEGVQWTNNATYVLLC